MTEEKMILNDGQYDLDMRTREVSASADVLADKGWHKLDDDEQIVKKVGLTKKEAEWLEKHKDLPFFVTDSNKHFSKAVFDYSMEYDLDKQEHFLNRLTQAYFTGYMIKKETKYYIKLNFGDNKYYKYLRADRYSGSWYWGSKPPTPLGKSQFTQSEIDVMQKDPQAKGLDLNALKVEVPDDELED